MGLNLKLSNILNAIVEFIKKILLSDTPIPHQKTDKHPVQIPVEKPVEIPVESPSLEITPELVRKTFMNNFEKFDGQRETKGHNRSAWIDKINKWIGAKLGSPYCATACSKALADTEAELGIKIHVKQTASSQSMWNETDKKYRVKIPFYGCIGVMYNYSKPTRGHIFVVRNNPDTKGFHNTFECNTDAAGNRDGDGCMFSIRNLKGDSSKGMRGYIDVGLAYEVLKKKPNLDIKIDVKNPDWNLISTKIELDSEPEKLVYLEKIRKSILSGKEKYLYVEQKTNVPWFFLGAIHFLEASCNFKGNLMNGQPINQATTIVPKGKGPWATWEESAIEAMVYDGNAGKKPSFWTFGNMLARAERYNGIGYRSKGVLSGYVTSFTNMSNEIGGYPRDHVYDPNYKRTRPGFAAILIYLNNKKDINLQKG